MTREHDLHRELSKKVGEPLGDPDGVREALVEAVMSLANALWLRRCERGTVGMHCVAGKGQVSVGATERESSD